MVEEQMSKSAATGVQPAIPSLDGPTGQVAAALPHPDTDSFPCLLGANAKQHKCGWEEGRAKPRYNRRAVAPLLSPILELLPSAEGANSHGSKGFTDSISSDSGMDSHGEAEGYE